jgi:hypothetical protein
MITLGRWLLAALLDGVLEDGVVVVGELTSNHGSGAQLTRLDGGFECALVAKNSSSDSLSSVFQCVGAAVSAFAD